MADETLDAIGLDCPLPLVKTLQTLENLDTGQVLQVLCTDPGSITDFQIFCKTTGNELLSHSANDGVYSFLIKRQI